MGYSEVVCHICGVSFNIGRIRKPSEPRSAAWSRHGPIINGLVVGSNLARYQNYSSFVEGERNCWEGECGRNAGCMFTVRKIHVQEEGKKCTVNSDGRIQLVNEDGVVEKEEEDDGTWEEEEEDDDEPLEYVSDVEQDDCDEEHDVEIEDSDEAECIDADKEGVRQLWIQFLSKPRTDDEHFRSYDFNGPAWYRDPITIENMEDVRDEMVPIFSSGDNGAAQDGKTRRVHPNDDNGSGNSWLDPGVERKPGYHPELENRVEHVAGPGCLNPNGYSGHEISVEEMRGCQVSQCLVRKPEGSDFSESDDDEDFEKNGAFFLSGISDHMPSRDMSSPTVVPPRHGCEMPPAENYIWNHNPFEEHAMPFHPWCFEVFKRASLLQHGIVDVDGLTGWWADDAKQRRIDRLRFDEDVRKCKDQEWQHCKGTAYLAANPLYIPKLQEIFREAVVSDPEFNPRNGAFHVPNTPVSIVSQDLFYRLPGELQIQILDDLASKDIASLRLASRTFRQLPIFYFQKLLNREMPWLWEAWQSLARLDLNLPYAFLSTLTASEVERKFPKKKTEKAIACLNDYVNIVSEEMPELKSILEEALPGEIQAVLDASQLEIDNDEDRKPFFVPPNRTNYYLLSMLLKRHWEELRGLRNRKRIWEDCQKILERIKNLREDGEIAGMAG